MRKQRQKIKDVSKRRQYRRKLSIRTKVIGSAEVPRVCAVKTNKHLSIQVIDDLTSKTIATAQTFGKSKVEGAKKSVEGAKVLGASLAASLKQKGISRAVFDRNGKVYHGVIASLADSLRENGIQI